MGVTAQGINREVAMAIECADRLRDEDVENKNRQRERPLGFPRLAVLNCAAKLPLRTEAPVSVRRKGILSEDDDTAFTPSWKNIARGILPSLRYLISEEKGSSTDAVTSITGKTDCAIQTLSAEYYGIIDPYANDYNCILCLCELANLYYSCNGCEYLLDKEYKICSKCLQRKMYNENRVMGLDKEKDDVLTIDFDPMRHHCAALGEEELKGSTNKGAKKKGVGLKGRTSCSTRGRKQGCSSANHQQFTEHRRFHTELKLQESLQNCEGWAGDDVVPFAEETEARLKKLKISIPDSLNVPKPYYPDLHE